MENAIQIYVHFLSLYILGASMNIQKYSRLVYIVSHSIVQVANQVGCFNHRVILIAYMLERQWLQEVYFGMKD